MKENLKTINYNKARLISWVDNVIITNFLKINLWIFEVLKFLLGRFLLKHEPHKAKLIFTVEDI